MTYFDGDALTDEVPCWLRTYILPLSADSRTSSSRLRMRQRPSHGSRCSKHGSRAPQGRRLVHHLGCLVFRCVQTRFVALSSAPNGVLLAVSFPTISKLLPFLRIPTVVFFIGKHFGTGVILATAFIHLLDDAFRSLQGPEVERRYPGLGKWTGAIMSVLSNYSKHPLSNEHAAWPRCSPSSPSNVCLAFRQSAYH